MILKNECRDKRAPMSEISKLSWKHDTIVEVFTFLLRQTYVSKLRYNSLLWNRGVRNNNFAQIGSKVRSVKNTQN